MKKYIIIIGWSLIAALSFSAGRCQKHRAEAYRMRQNFEAVAAGMEKYMTENERNAATVQVQTLKIQEFEKYYTELAQYANDLELQNRRLLSAARTTTVTEYQIQTVWRDSIVFENASGKIDTIRCIDYEDRFLTFSLCNSDSSIAQALIRHRDEMAQFVHRVPRFQWWFIRIGTKGIRQDVTFANPNTQIEYTEFINFVK